MTKTKRVAARLTPLDIEKIKRYYNYPTIRNLIESVIKVSEDNKLFRLQLKEAIENSIIVKSDT